MIPVTITELGQVIVARIDQHRLDSFEPIAKELLGQFEAGTRSQGSLLVDCERVSSMTGLVISQLIQLGKRCRGQEVPYKLCCIAPKIREVFEVTDPEFALAICDTRESALQALEE